jgi:uncharacterized membrane protein YkoI
MSILKTFAAASVPLAVVAIGGALFLTRGADAGTSGALDDGKDLLPQASITLDEAIAAAQSQYRGAVDEIDLEQWHGRLVFNVDVGDRDVKVDAGTGDVLGAGKD